MKLDHNWQHKLDLLSLLTRKEISLKYKRAVLGILWSLLNPILLAAVFFLAFKVFMRFKVENYTFFLLSALFSWNWFSSSVLLSARTLIDNVTLIKKVIFPRQYLVISVILCQLIHLLCAIPILFFFSFKDGMGPSWTWLIGIPLLLVIQFAFTLGITLIVSILNTFFRDTEYLAGVGMNLIFWITPVTYPLTAIPEKFRPFFLLNPLTSLMFSWRELITHNVILWDKLGISFVAAILSIVAGTLIFKKLERKIDEVL